MLSVPLPSLFSIDLVGIGNDFDERDDFTITTTTRYW
jgi:hypothetical protein